jgi:hypothetical protein
MWRIPRLEDGRALKSLFDGTGGGCPMSVGELAVPSLCCARIEIHPTTVRKVGQGALDMKNGTKMMSHPDRPAQERRRSKGFDGSRMQSIVQRVPTR